MLKNAAVRGVVVEGKEMRRKHKKINQKKEKTSKWIIINSLSQFLLTILAIFGYFYTIQPIRQNQLLNEEKAFLQNEKNKLQEEFKVLNTQYQELITNNQILTKKTMN